MKRTFQPSNKKKRKTHGFRKRMKTSNGKKIINKRRKIKRKKIINL
ncbi:50S ribosomal protein L34 [Candidatus Vidania fulgoroideorum]